MLSSPLAKKLGTKTTFFKEYEPTQLITFPQLKRGARSDGCNLTLLDETVDPRHLAFRFGEFIFHFEIITGKEKTNELRSTFIARHQSQQ